MKRLLLGLLLATLVSACSTGDPDPDPADPGNRIGRTITKADSALNPARAHIRTIDTIGAGVD